jgi:hypothetical protein
MDDLSAVAAVDAAGWTIEADRLREQIRWAQRTGHANCFFQKFTTFHESSGEELSVVCVYDLYDERWPTKSVTNDAEFVVDLVFNTHGDMPIVYRDTEGRWDELRHREGYFATFRSLDTRDQSEAVRRVLALHEQDRAEYASN